MTFVTVVVCTEGLIFASDGQATRRTDNNNTKEIARKIFRFGKNKLWGSSGPEDGVVKFMAFLAEIAKKNPTDNELTVHLERFASDLRDKTPKCKECNEYLVVGHHDYPVIWQITNGCASLNPYGKENTEMLKDSMIAIGAGQTVPRTFFKSLKPIGRDYSLEQGSLIAYRLVREAMNSTDGVGEPIDIWTIRNDEVTPKSAPELEELRRLCIQWEASELLMARVALLSRD